MKAFIKMNSPVNGPPFKKPRTGGFSMFETPREGNNFSDAYKTNGNSVPSPKPKVTELIMDDEVFKAAKKGETK